MLPLSAREEGKEEVYITPPSASTHFADFMPTTAKDAENLKQVLGLPKDVKEVKVQEIGNGLIVNIPHNLSVLRRVYDGDEKYAYWFKDDAAVESFAKERGKRVLGNNSDTVVLGPVASFS